MEQNSKIWIFLGVVFGAAILVIVIVDPIMYVLLFIALCLGSLILGCIWSVSFLIAAIIDKWMEKHGRNQKQNSEIKETGVIA